MIDLLRLRLVLAGVMMCLVAISAGVVFDQQEWTFLIAPVIVTVAAWSVFARRWTGRLATGVIAIVSGTTLVVIIAGGDAADVVASFGSSTQRLLSTEWPSPDRPELLGTVATLLGIATLAAAELTHRARFHLSPLLPVLAAQLLIISLSAPHGPQWWTLTALALLAVIFTIMRPGAEMELRDRLALLRGERRLIPAACLTIGVAALVAVPLTLSGRADPRRNEPAASSASLIDPIEATLALQTIEPPIELHELQVSSDVANGLDAVPTRWRTAALSRYDGRRWSPNLVLRPIGRRLNPPADDEIDYTITFENDDVQFVPLPGAPIVIDAPIETDEARTLVGLLERPVAGDPYRVTARVEPTPEEAVGSIGVIEADENTTALADLAQGLAREGGAEETTDFLEQLRGIEATMREEFVLRTDAPGGGLQRLLIERFLRETRRGNAEQFATAFVLLARSLGVEARVATGYEIDPTNLDTTGDLATLTILSTDAAVWPEVRIGDRWVAFDPTPPEESTDSSPPPVEPQVQTPAPPQPPIDEPPDAVDDPVVADEVVDEGTPARLSVVVTYALYVGVVVAILLVPVLLFVLIVLGAKRRRRRRRLSGSARERVRGAWSLATNALVDGGMSITKSETNDEIAIVAAGYAPKATRELRRLARLSSTTTFGDPTHPELLADDAVACLNQVEATMSEGRTRRQRIGWRLSLRSLRSSTTSPV